MRYAVILAGGAGQRLWPLSREGRPKQLLPLIMGKSLLELAVERLEGAFAPSEHPRRHQRRIRRPGRRRRAGPAAGEHHRRAARPRHRQRHRAWRAEMSPAATPKATMAVFTADHVIRPARTLRPVRAARRCEAAEAATRRPGDLRHPPDLAAHGAGLHPLRPAARATPCYKVSGFKEKPDHPTARRYVESGEYYWNSGMFVWKLQAIRTALAKFLPDSVAKLAASAGRRAGRTCRPPWREAYPRPAEDQHRLRRHGEGRPRSSWWS